MSVRIVRVITGITSALIIVLGVLSIIMIAFGYRPITILSDSMKPAFSAGDAVLAKKTEGNYEIGDIIAFLPYENNDTLIIHRVISTEPLQTQGDANVVADSPIVSDQVRFDVVDHIVLPKMGYVLTWPFAVKILVISGLLLLVAGGEWYTKYSDRK